ncbi:MAG TPA: thioredoxin domain-containing protein [Thermoanaerobaculia bacterium]|jgi:thiol-disulfide isomerase/thioredoxin
MLARARPSVLLSLLVVLLAGAAMAAGPAWSKNVRLFEAQLGKVEVPKGGGSINFQLPQLRVYDAKGARVLDITGYSAAFSATLTSVLKGNGRADAARPLARELDRIRTAGGKPLAPLPKADFTIVEYWADWCVPCHAQARDMAMVLAALSDVEVNLLHVNADLNKIKPELVQVPVVELDDLDPALLKKLNDPGLSEEEKKKLLREAAEARKKGKG